MKRICLLMTVIASIFVVVGCGQSGPLYIPGNPSQMAVPPSQEIANTENPEDGEDDSEAPEQE
jgi:predicted small lipoprotein YifL